jgi:hypothetical protein
MLVPPKTKSGEVVAHGRLTKGLTLGHAAFVERRSDIIA